jgi:hypothetical protein
VRVRVPPSAPPKSITYGLGLKFSQNLRLSPDSPSKKAAPGDDVLSYGKIIWTDTDWESTDWESEKVDDVKRYLADREMTSYVDIAEHLDCDPVGRTTSLQGARAAGVGGGRRKESIRALST